MTSSHHLPAPTRAPRVSDKRGLPRTVPGPFGKMGKLRIRERNRKGRRSPRSRRGNWWRRDSNPREQAPAPARSAFPSSRRRRPCATRASPGEPRGGTRPPGVLQPCPCLWNGETEAPHCLRSPGSLLPRPKSVREPARTPSAAPGPRRSFARAHREPRRERKMSFPAARWRCQLIGCGRGPRAGLGASLAAAGAQLSGKKTGAASAVKLVIDSSAGPRGRARR